MKAHVGDRLVPDGDDAGRAWSSAAERRRVPALLVKWLSDGHIALVYPGPYARVVPGGGTADLARCCSRAGGIRSGRRIKSAPRRGRGTN